MSSPKLLFTSEFGHRGTPDKSCATKIADSVLGCLHRTGPDEAGWPAKWPPRPAFVMLLGRSHHRLLSLWTNWFARSSPRSATTAPRKALTQHLRGLSAIGQPEPGYRHGRQQIPGAKDGDRDQIDLIGAGDQGMMFGFACNETEQLMPIAQSNLAHKLTRTLAEVRKAGPLPWAVPGRQKPVTVEIPTANQGASITVLVLGPAFPQGSHADIEEGIMEHVISRPCRRHD